MQVLVVRLELSSEAARLVEGIVAGHLSQVEGKLLGIVPEHTKKRLEEQAEHAGEALRELARARANPIEVEVPDPEVQPGE